MKGTIFGFEGGVLESSGVMLLATATLCHRSYCTCPLVSFCTTRVPFVPGSTLNSVHLPGDTLTAPDNHVLPATPEEKERQFHDTQT